MSKMYSAEEYFDQGSGIVTICGSTKFFFEAMEVNRILTFKNWMVFMCGSWGHSFHKFDQSMIERNYEVVKKLYFQKILESQAIVVVSDHTEYIGDSTKAEMAFAKYRNIPVFQFYGNKFVGMTDRIPLDRHKDTSLIDEFAKKYGGLGF